MHWGIFAIMGIEFRYQLSGFVFASFFPLERLVSLIRRAEVGGPASKVKPQPQPTTRHRPYALVLIAGIAIASGIGAFRWFRPPSPSRIVVHEMLRGNTPTDSSIDSRDISAAIDSAADYLAGVTQSNGRFIYRTYLNSPRIDSQSYNLLRHAGTIYAMSAAQERSPSSKLGEAISRATRFLIEQIQPIQDAPSPSAVWSQPQTTNETRVPTAKLGGTGLGVLALTRVERLFPGTVSPDTFSRLGEFLIFMQRDDGSFHTKYTPWTGGYDDTLDSLFYPGEAILGLLAIYSRDPNERWFRTAERGLLYLATTRAGNPNPPADHWALIATGEYLNSASAISRENRQVVTRHAIAICESILREQIVSDADPMVVGAFTRDGRTTPTATRLEGLLAALEFLVETENADLTARMRRGIDAGIKFLLASRVVSGDRLGGIPRAIGRLTNIRTEQEIHANRRAGEIRIDYVQHALSAFIAYETLMRYK
jgi:hypothetical protein